MIKALSKDGKVNRQVLYNEVILMIDKYDTLTFHAINEEFNFEMKFNFEFSDSGDEFKANGNFSQKDKELTLKLEKWYSQTRVENTEPLEFDLDTGLKIWVKYGTSAIEKRDFRMFHLTVWGEL
ncbi:MAG TPA: hypothetical protein VKN14_02425 [Flavobacteriaceae bacterium]|nr:hypothetical protein [Flavobacteriaceae bacterium]